MAMSLHSKSVENLLDRSDEMHLEILGILEVAQPFPELRYQAGLTACGMSLEHASAFACSSAAPATPQHFLCCAYNMKL